MPTPSDPLVQNIVDKNLVDKNIEQIDNKLSQRFIALDPAGYFIIYIDPDQNLIYAKHFTNEVNAQGLAVDPETGKVIPAKGKVSREPSHIFQAYTAKQLCVEIFEASPETKTMIAMLDHAAYIGREAQKAEQALRHHQAYIQD
jgi:dihydropteroate synthase